VFGSRPSLSPQRDYPSTTLRVVPLPTSSAREEELVALHRP
jgi:hypothetical protein